MESVRSPLPNWESCAVGCCLRSSRRGCVMKGQTAGCHLFPGIHVCSERARTSRAPPRESAKPSTQRVALQSGGGRPVHLPLAPPPQGDPWLQLAPHAPCVHIHGRSVCTLCGWLLPLSIILGTYTHVPCVNSHSHSCVSFHVQTNHHLSVPVFFKRLIEI